ncbi:hypothetical protein [uncultured Sulfitobacter sp.]|uniref:hypothetical protein n=1 Tax=uncultured Sulfitobacter sp. TaxID=191468 RepID=UPI00262B9803|nr:hypothetical protein [uncultured Sulfitobacter sp.]
MLRARAGQHTLTCGACGAPLRNLKMLPVAAPVSKPAITHQPRVVKQAKPAYVKSPKPAKKSKKRKGFLRKLAEEAFDLVEDIFD